jgi:hypothetical protein
MLAALARRYAAKHAVAVRRNSCRSAGLLLQLGMFPLWSLVTAAVTARRALCGEDRPFDRRSSQVEGEKERKKCSQTVAVSRRCPALSVAFSQTNPLPRVGLVLQKLQRWQESLDLNPQHLGQLVSGDGAEHRWQGTRELQANDGSQGFSVEGARFQRNSNG